MNQKVSQPFLSAGTLQAARTEVRDHFEEYILAEKQRIATGTPEEPVNLTPVDPGSQPETPALNLYVVIFAALVDSINPCAFAVLIILIAYLTSLGERRRIAVVGCTYIATVFIVYFIAGLGLLTFVQGIGLTGIVFTFAAVVAIIAGLINIAEVLLKREIFTLAIPVSQKDAIDRYIKKASVPSAIVLGALVAMVELPCTGGIYLAILGLLGDRMTLAEGIPYLLLYNLIFVLPLILILIVMYWGGTPERLEAFRSGSKRWVRLVMGIVMVALGGQCFLGYYKRGKNGMSGFPVPPSGESWHFDIFAENQGQTFNGSFRPSLSEISKPHQMNITR